MARSLEREQKTQIILFNIPAGSVCARASGLCPEQAKLLQALTVNLYSVYGVSSATTPCRWDPGTSAALTAVGLEGGWYLWTM